MSGILRRQATITVLTALVLVVGGATTSFSQTADAPASVKLEPAGENSATPNPAQPTPNSPTPGTNETALEPHDCTRFEIATKAYEDGRCTRRDPGDNADDGKQDVVQAVKKNQCNLTKATNRWASGLSDVRQLTTSLDRIIDNIDKNTGDYQDEKFGDKNYPIEITENRDKAKKRFTMAKDLIEQVMRQVAGESNQACRDCQKVSDYNLLRSAAHFVYQSKYFEKSEDRIGAGSLIRTKEMQEAEQKIDDETIVQTDPKKTEMAPTMESHWIPLKAVSRGMFNCLIRKVNGADDDEKPLSNYFIQSIAKSLCEGHEAWLRDDGDELRKEKIKDIQSNFNHLFDDLKECETEVNSEKNASLQKTNAEAMITLTEKMNCEAESFRPVPDFFTPRGRFGTKDEVCNWSNAHNTLIKVGKGG